jgi:hypothetical protein
MSETQAHAIISEQVAEFFLAEFLMVRDVTAAQKYWTQLDPSWHWILVENFISASLRSSTSANGNRDPIMNEADADDAALLVSHFFALSSAKGNCSLESFERGFSAVASDFANKMAIVMKGPGFKESDAVEVTYNACGGGLGYKLKI